MIIVIAIMVFSYGVFTSANLSSAALVAKSYEDQKYDVFVLYGHTQEDDRNIGTHPDIIDKGELTIKNPNSQDVIVKTVMIIENTDLDLSKIEIDIDGNKIDKSQARIVNGAIELDLETKELSSYKTAKSTISIYGNPLELDEFDYTFNVIESFYE